MATLARFRSVIAVVPREKVITYGQVAEASGFPRAARVGADRPRSREASPGCEESFDAGATPGTDLRILGLCNG